MKADWPVIFENLRKTLEPGVFKVWIAPLEGEIRDHTVSLTAQSEFAAGWVRERFGSTILEAAAAALGVDAAALNLSVNAEDRPPARRVLSPHEACERPRAEQGLLLAPDYAPRPRWRFSFEDFVVGPSNEMAYAAAKGLCAEAANADTLFVSSSPGLGKTHLAHAMGKYLSETATASRVIYLTAEEFASGFVAALKARDVEGFKERLRQCDVLLLEDVHFLRNKEKMQEEILTLMKSLQSRGSRLVLTSSFAPRELDRMDSRLVSLFCSGLLAHMAGPNLETRRRILSEKARLHQVFLPDAVSELLAARITTDIRRLESCLNNLIFKAGLLNSRISLEMAVEMVQQYAQEQSALDMAGIIGLVCASCRLTLPQLASRSRKSEYVQARNTIYYLARKHTDLSLQEIGEHFNRRHSSVIKGISAVEFEMRRETPLGRQFSNTVTLIERNAGCGRA